MKYIDSEKLIALIDAKLEDLGMSGSVWVGRSVLNELKDDIESLQQEQSEVDLNKEIQSFWNANALEYRLGHVADINFLAYTARHFAEWGAIHLNARKEEKI